MERNNLSIARDMAINDSVSPEKFANAIHKLADENGDSLEWAETLLTDMLNKALSD